MSNCANTLYLTDGLSQSVVSNPMITALDMNGFPILNVAEDLSNSNSAVPLSYLNTVNDAIQTQITTINGEITTLQEQTANIPVNPSLWYYTHYTVPTPLTELTDAQITLASKQISGTNNSYNINVAFVFQAVGSPPLPSTLYGSGAWIIAQIYDATDVTVLSQNQYYLTGTDVSVSGSFATVSVPTAMFLAGSNMTAGHTIYLNILGIFPNALAEYPTSYWEVAPSTIYTQRLGIQEQLNLTFAQ